MRLLPFAVSIYSWGQKSSAQKIGFNVIWEQAGIQSKAVWVFIPTGNNFCCVSYQGIEHQSVERVAVRVLHHDVEESIQSVLQELKWQMQIIGWQANNKMGHLTKKKKKATTTHIESLAAKRLSIFQGKMITRQVGCQEWDTWRHKTWVRAQNPAARSAGRSSELGYNFKWNRKKKRSDLCGVIGDWSSTRRTVPISLNS